jgi:flavin reductase ActVB
MPVDTLAFRQALAQFPSGITVVTARDAGGRPQGLTVSAFCSVSMEPPLVLVCVDERAEADGAIRSSRLFGVSVLAEGQEQVSRRFASGGPDKFEGIELVTGRHGTLLVPGALAHIECRVRSGHSEGDHTVWVGEVVSLATYAGRPLVYHARGYRRLDGAAGATGDDRV